MPRREVRVAADGDAAVEQGLADLHRELDLPDAFPPEVLAEAESAAKAPRLPDLDRTEIPFVTIDPESSRDLDQALHLERAGTGFRVHYAIADVAAFVEPAGAIDVEAHRRGETLYGPANKIPLHPPQLSEAAASLLPDGPRPALLWTIDLDADGAQTDVRVERAMVRSRAKLSYAGVQADLDAGRADPVFDLLREVGRLRLDQEAARGGVSLPLPDQEVARGDDGWVLDYRRQLDVEQWNAQVSLLTGMAAAGLMVQGRIGVLRTLAPADPDGIARLRRVAAALHVSWPADTSYPDLVRSLDPARPEHAALLTESTSLLRGSGYVAFDGSLPEERRHSAIAADYAHTTAPLRRLVDRYAGEACVALCAGTEVPDWVRQALPELPETMRESARRANTYEREVLDLVEAAVLQDRVGESFTAVVVSTSDKDPAEGEVMVTDPAVEARVESGDGGRPLPLGDEVQVRLTEADPARRRVRFTLA
jgi:exoribonuclease R